MCGMAFLHLCYIIASSWNCICSVKRELFVLVQNSLTCKMRGAKREHSQLVVQFFLGAKRELRVCSSKRMKSAKRELNVLAVEEIRRREARTANFLYEWYYNNEFCDV